MSNRGRKALPTKLKILKGTAKKSRLHKNEMDPDEVGFIPEPPKGLNKHGSIAWNEMCEVLVRLGILTDVDKHMLGAYCMEWGKYLEAEEKLREVGRTIRTGNGSLKLHPMVAISRDSLRAAHAIAQQFGFTPSSRGRIEMPKPKAVKQQSPQGLLKVI